MEGTRRIEQHSGIIRAGMILLIVPQLIAGAWAFVAPRNFWESFPGFGRVWVAPVGAYNQHFISDVGNLLIITAVLVGLAAFYLERRLVRIALVLWMMFSVPHFISHVRLASLFDTVDNVGNLGTLGIAVLLPLVLLFLAERSEPRP